MKRKPLRILLIFLGILLIVAIAMLLWARPVPAHPFYSNFGDWPLAIAHQGGDGLWPGDTLLAMQKAVEMNIDMLEMDIHRSQDGTIVLMHDETVDRTTDGTGFLKEMTLAEIQKLDAGYDWTSDGGGTFPYRGQGIRVPTLEQVFQAFPDTPMNIEIKQVDPPIDAAFCELIRKYERQNLVLVASFDDHTIQSFRQACPEVATSTAEGETRKFVILNLAFLGSFYKPQANAVQVPEERSGIHILTPRFIQAAHQRGFKVDAWTINEPEGIQRMINLGVDGIISDYPDRLVEILGR